MCWLIAVFPRQELPERHEDIPGQVQLWLAGTTAGVGGQSSFYSQHSCLTKSLQSLCTYVLVGIILRVCGLNIIRICIRLYIAFCIKTSALPVEWKGLRT